MDSELKVALVMAICPEPLGFHLRMYGDAYEQVYKVIQIIWAEYVHAVKSKMCVQTMEVVGVTHATTTSKGGNNICRR